MEHVYTVHTKLIHDKTYYFVKKLLALPEFPGLAEIVIGYGMHADFEKACNIAGVKDLACRQQLLTDLEKSNKPALYPQIINRVVPVKPAVQQHTIEIADMINSWLAERGAEVLN